MLNPIIDTLLMLESNSIFAAAWQMLHFCTNHLDFQRNRKELELLLTLFWAPATVFVVAEAVMCRGWLSWLNSSWGCFFESGSHNHENSTWRLETLMSSQPFGKTQGAWSFNRFCKDTCRVTLGTWSILKPRSQVVSYLCMHKSFFAPRQKRVARVKVGKHVSWA